MGIEVRCAPNHPIRRMRDLFFLSAIRRANPNPVPTTRTRRHGTTPARYATRTCRAIVVYWRILMPRNTEVLNRVQALEDEVRIIRQVLPPKARLALALAHTRSRAKGVSSRAIASAAERAVRAVRRSVSRRSA